MALSMTGRSLSLPIRIPTKGFFINTPLPSPSPSNGEGEGKYEIRIAKSETNSNDQNSKFFLFRKLGF
jgi:hypothetical protein